MIRIFIVVAFLLVTGYRTFAQATCGGTMSQGVTCVTAQFSNGGGTINETSSCVGNVGCTGSGGVFAPTAGHTVIVALSNCGDSTCSAASTKTITMSDNINNPETCFTASPHSPIDINIGAGTQFNREYWFICPSIPSGVTSLTATCSVVNGCSFIFFYASEWTGLPTSGTLVDVEATGSSPNATNVTTMSLSTPTPNATNELVLSNVQTINDESQTIDTSDRSLDQSVVGVLLAGFIQTTAASHTITTHWTVGDKWWTTMIALKTNASVTGSSNKESKRDKLSILDP